MPEKVQTYLLDDPETLIPMDREAFYDEQLAVDTPTRAVEIVNILLFNEHGELFVQKRSRTKKHNPGMIDKSIGGHVTYGDTADYTAMVETLQELQVPSVVLRSQKDLVKTMGLLRNYLETIALTRHVDTKIITLNKVFDGVVHPIANKAHLYLGVYGGRVKTVDREAQGILTYQLGQLEEEMLTYPKLFTDDLAVFLRKYHQEIVDFQAMITQTK